MLGSLGPKVGRVLTCNAETSRHMVDINEHLGFEPVEIVPLLQLKVTAKAR